jgi:hypothetical protein
VSFEANRYSVPFRLVGQTVSVKREGEWLRIELDWSFLGLGNLEQLTPEAVRHVLTTLVERIVLDPATLKYEIHYRLPLTGVRMASPRGDVG